LSQPPICFISYSREDSPTHKDWVRKLAESLQRNGVQVILDQWELGPGVDKNQFMEKSVREADYVILVCTPKYADKANERRGGTGYENTIISGELYYQNSTDKFVPIIRSGSYELSLPSYLKSRIAVDFRDESHFKISLEELLRKFHDSPRYVQPPLGPKPNYTSDISIGVSGEGQEIKYCKRCGALAGPRSECHTFSGAHDFAVESGTIFCELCGAIPGKPTSCHTFSSDHSFVTSRKNPDKIHCECGLGIGKSTSCDLSFFGNHDFK